MRECGFWKQNIQLTQLKMGETQLENFPLSVVTVPEIFAKVNSTQSSSRIVSKVANSNLNEDQFTENACKCNL